MRATQFRHLMALGKRQFDCRFFYAVFSRQPPDYYTDAFRWVLKQSFLTKTAEKVFSASPI
ncbi:hypothetical protein AKL19_21475 [Vibrio parahaemolyticus O4:K55 str. NY3547]|nr:hypothetical protein BBL85_16470 [Vibrio parahaemolyticus]OQK10927.1 hypothetical protein AKL19_21475 [Vibrio parahaemolyticus O4:K55 str. NY3547]